MSKALTMEEIAELEQRFAPSLRVTAVCSMARAHLELTEALEFLDAAGCSIDHPNYVGRVVEPQTIKTFAKHLGWRPGQ